MSAKIDTVRREAFGVVSAVVIRTLSSSGERFLSHLFAFKALCQRLAQASLDHRPFDQGVGDGFEYSLGDRCFRTDHDLRPKR